MNINTNSGRKPSMLGKKRDASTDSKNEQEVSEVQSTFTAIENIVNKTLPNIFSFSYVMLLLQEPAIEERLFAKTDEKGNLHTMKNSLARCLERVNFEVQEQQR